MNITQRRRGFTLVEILIVVSIIVIVLSMILGSLAVARKKTALTQAQSFVSSVDAALRQFHFDKGYYPGSNITDPGDNAFPELFSALDGMGGKYNAYMEFKENQVYVLEDPATNNYRPATFDERMDVKVNKYILDPWARPYWYRENASKPPERWRRKPSAADLWSCGPDGVNQALNGEKGDDIGNW